MAEYNEMDSGGGAAAQLESPGGAGDQAPQAREDTFFIPEDFPGAADLKAGDKITLRVVGKDSDGQLEVEPCSKDQSGAEPMNWRDDMRQSMGGGSPSMGEE